MDKRGLNGVQLSEEVKWTEIKNIEISNSNNSVLSSDNNWVHV